MGKKRRVDTAQDKPKPAKHGKSNEENVNEETEGIFGHLDDKLNPPQEASMGHTIAILGGEDMLEDGSPHDGAQDSELSDPESHDNDDDDVSMHDTELDASADHKKDSDTKLSKASQFRDRYMADMTLAFGSDLDMLRKEPDFDSLRLNVLINSLEAGIDIFSELEQQIILEES